MRKAFLRMDVPQFYKLQVIDISQSAGAQTGARASSKQTVGDGQTVG